MENIISRQYPAKVKLLFLFLACGILFFAKVDFTYAVTKTTIASGLNAAVGAAIDESKNQLYFVEYNPPGNGTLKRINLPPECGTSTTPPCDTTITTIADNFSHPEDVQLDLAHGFAYVTTRDDLGTTGALWKVNLSTGSKSMVTFNLGAPQQLVLDIANNQAYTVGYDDGRLRRIDLTTGVKTPIFKGLEEPVGLAITKDRKYAYVTEQHTPARISKIDLTMGVKVEEVITDGISGVSLVAPFFLAWTDNSQNSLYIVERDPANKVSRVELATSTKYDAITEIVPPPLWWWRPSGIVVSSANTPIYVTTDKAIVKVGLALDTSEPGFMGVGHVPISKIDGNGYATTDPGYFFEVKNAPFGGTLNIFGNLYDWINNLSATHYKVEVSKDGAVPVGLGLSWNAYKWNPILSEYELVPVAPDPITKKYAIPAEYISNPAWWYPSFLIMRWPSGENGLYTFTLRLYDGGGTDITPAGLEELTVLIDNTPPTVNIHNIFQNKPPITDIEPCVIVDNGKNEFTFKITANDTDGHLHSYALSALYGNNQYLPISSDSYNNHINPPPPPYAPVLWSGVVNQIVPASPEDVPCNCAYTFYLGAWGRTINGYNRIQYVDYHKSITINLPTLSICTSP